MAAIEAELEERLDGSEAQGKLLEAQRLEQRTRFDLEMMREMGYCHGIENYSRHLTGRAPGEPPPTLLDYLPRDYPGGHRRVPRTIPQLAGDVRGATGPGRQTLVDYGFRLPSALDNRPLDLRGIRAPGAADASMSPPPRAPTKWRRPEAGSWSRSCAPPG